MTLDSGLQRRLAVLNLTNVVKGEDGIPNFHLRLLENVSGKFNHFLALKEKELITIENITSYNLADSSVVEFILLNFSIKSGSFVPMERVKQKQTSFCSMYDLPPFSEDTHTLGDILVNTMASKKVSLKVKRIKNKWSLLGLEERKKPLDIDALQGLSELDDFADLEFVENRLKQNGTDSNPEKVFLAKNEPKEEKPGDLGVSVSDRAPESIVFASEFWVEPPNMDSKFESLFSDNEKVIFFSQVEKERQACLLFYFFM